MKVEMYGLRLPVVSEKVDLVGLILDYLRERGIKLEDGDILVLTSKFVQKALGLVVDLSSIKPSFRAKLISKLTGKDPVETQVILNSSRRILFGVSTSFLKEYIDRLSRETSDAVKALENVKYILITESRNGFITTDSGLDYSNLPPGKAVVNAYDFDSIAREIREEFRRRVGVDISVVITDTEFTLSNGKFGSLDYAVGTSGIAVVTREFGSRDLYGRPKFGGLDIVVDEISAAAALLMRQCREGVPAVLIKGLEYERSNEGVKTILVTRFHGQAIKLLIKNMLLIVLLKLLRIL